MYSLASKFPLNKERDNKTISYRKFGSTDTTTLGKEEFMEMLSKEIENKSL